MSVAHTSRITLLIFIFLFSQGAVRAQSPTEEESARAAQESVESLASIGTGTNDITSQLALDAAPKQSLILTPRLDSALAKWYDRKADILQRRGLRFVLAYSVLGQHATETIAGNQDNAVGGVFDFGGTWELLNRNTDWRGVLGFRIADQHRLGTDIAPSELGEQVGSAWGTSLAFSDLSLNLIEGWWEQRLAGKVAVRLGKIESSGIFDASSLGNPFERFLGQPFTLNNTIPFPAEGLGIVGVLELPEDFQIVAGIADANGNGKDWNFDSFFDEREHLQLVEFVWAPEMSFGKGDYHLTVWRSDEREKGQVPGGQGYTFYGEQRFGNVMPFIRYGHASGGASALKNQIATGAGFYSPFGRFSDGIGLGFSWGESFSNDVRDQYGIESYYRIQITRELAITPNIQYIKDPARNLEVSSLFVVGLRLRAAF